MALQRLGGAYTSSCNEKCAFGGLLVCDWCMCVCVVCGCKCVCVCVVCVCVYVCVWCVCV